MTKTGGLRVGIGRGHFIVKGSLVVLATGVTAFAEVDDEALGPADFGELTIFDVDCSGMASSALDFCRSGGRVDIDMRLFFGDLPVLDGLDPADFERAATRESTGTAFFGAAYEQ